MINKFEDILAWQKSKIFVLKIYDQFKFCKDFSFKDQILRAAVSIMNNTAEVLKKWATKILKNFYIFLKVHVAKLDLCYILPKN